MRKKRIEIKGKLITIIREMAATPWLFVKKPRKYWEQAIPFPVG